MGNLFVEGVGAKGKSPHQEMWVGSTMWGLGLFFDGDEDVLEKIKKG